MLDTHSAPLDEEWRVTFLNGRAEDLLDCDAADLLGTDVWDAFPGAVGTEIPDRCREAAKTGEPVSFELHYDSLDTIFGIQVYPPTPG